MELALSKPHEPEQGAKISPSDPTPSDREQDVRRSVFATSCDRVHKDEAWTRASICRGQPLIRLDAVLMFEDMGYRVLEASDGREALGILESGSAVSILFTDTEMPHLGGLELAVIVAGALAGNRHRDHVRPPRASRGWPAG